MVVFRGVGEEKRCGNRAKEGLDIGFDGSEFGKFRENVGGRYVYVSSCVSGIVGQTGTGEVFYANFIRFSVQGPYELEARVEFLFLSPYLLCIPRVHVCGVSVDGRFYCFREEGGL